MQTIEELRNNITATVLIAGPELGAGLRLFMTGKLGISSSNGWDSLMQSSAQENLDRKISIGKNIASTAGLGGLSGLTVKNRDQTKLSYSGPSRPEFSMEILLINTTLGVETVLRDIKQLYKTVMPSSSSFIGSGEDSAGQFYRAPLGYSGEGNLSISISTWFRADHLVMSGVQMTPSFEVDPSGNPLYAQGSISFQPAHIPTYQEFMRYFKG